MAKFDTYFYFLAIAMVITGSLNTIFSSLAIRTKAVGENGDKHSFDHPYFQTVAMFIGEFLCLIAFKANWAYSKMTNRPIKQVTPFNPLIFLLPAACDMVASSAMTVGLTWTYPSVYQMLRGSVMICTGIFSVVFLKRKLKLYHWLGMLSVLSGLVLVGVASVLQGGSSSDAPHPLWGDIIIVAAQLIVATQMVVEEKFIGKYEVPPLLVVGWEGVFGSVMLSTLLIPMYFLPAVESNDAGNHFENTPDAFVQMSNSWIISASLVGSIFSIAFFNFFGISITKYASATTRTVIDSIRTITIWAFSLIVGWQEFQYLQLVGFFFLICGTLIYNEVVVLRFLGPHFVPDPKPTEVEKQTLLTNSTEDDDYS
mmetsp:Transcript_27339/g.38539  ORF Transcript_27339/g.38539 Transcript_27339/m.38539 type:complete len:369 (-) Transcript_27339:79-1185(-)